MGENVRELTPIERENAELKARIEALEKELAKDKETQKYMVAQYEEANDAIQTLREKNSDLRLAIVAQAVCMRDYMEQDDLI